MGCNVSCNSAVPKLRARTQQCEPDGRFARVRAATSSQESKDSEDYANDYLKESPGDFIDFLMNIFKIL